MKRIKEYRMKPSYRLFKEYIKNSNKDTCNGTYLVYYGIKHNMTTSEFSEYLDKEISKMSKAIRSNGFKISFCCPFYYYRDIFKIIPDKYFKTIKNIPYTLDTTKEFTLDYFETSRICDSENSYFSYVITHYYDDLLKNVLLPSIDQVSEDSLWVVDYINDRSKLGNLDVQLHKVDSTGDHSYTATKYHYIPNELYLVFETSRFGGDYYYTTNCKKLKLSCLTLFHLLKMLDNINNPSPLVREDFCKPIEWNSASIKYVNSMPSDEYYKLRLDFMRFQRLKTLEKETEEKNKFNIKSIIKSISNLVKYFKK